MDSRGRKPGVPGHLPRRRRSTDLLPRSLLGDFAGWLVSVPASSRHRYRGRTISPPRRASFIWPLRLPLYGCLLIARTARIFTSRERRTVGYSGVPAYRRICAERFPAQVPNGSRKLVKNVTSDIAFFSFLPLREGRGQRGERAPSACRQCALGIHRA